MPWASSARIARKSMFAVRKDSPLIIGVGQGENFIASDVPAILSLHPGYLPAEGPGDRRPHPGSIDFYNQELDPIQKEPRAHPVGH